MALVLETIRYNCNTSTFTDHILFISSNIVYAFFDTFGVIHTITSGGPEQSTTILVYKVFSDGFVSQDLGSSAAQSVILLVLVGILTVIQFKYIERKVHY